jgi:hypothetical protein
LSHLAQHLAGPIESDMAPETPAAVQAGKWRENLTALLSIVKFSRQPISPGTRRLASDLE